MTSTTQTEAEPEPLPSPSLSPSSTSASGVSAPCRDRDRDRSSTVLPLEAINNLQSSPNIISRRTSYQRVKMATAKLKQHFHAPHGHRLFRSNSSNLVHQQPIDEEQLKKEKDFISCYECNSAPLSPNQLDEDPRNKELGAASKQLRVGDFQLIKTIGTGESCVQQLHMPIFVEEYSLT